MTDQTILHTEDRPDVLEFGPAGSRIRVKGNADDPEAFERRMKNMVELRRKALAELVKE